MAPRQDDGLVTPLPAMQGEMLEALQPEGRLMLAVLEGAVSDFQKYATASTGRGRRLFAEADSWLASMSTALPFDFECICQALALEPSAIRTRLRGWWAARQRDGADSGVVHVPIRRMCGSRHRIVVANT
jgi:hypothetical protein